jgi:hypothetical protein
MADKVPVRPGWRKTPDGKVPRVGRPDRDGREWPGNYLFHKVVGTGAEATFEFLGMDCEESVIDTQSVRHAIREGYLVVTDESHALFSFNTVDPSAKDAPATPKKAARKDEN